MHGHWELARGVCSFRVQSGPDKLLFGGLSLFLVEVARFELQPVDAFRQWRFERRPLTRVCRQNYVILQLLSQLLVSDSQLELVS